MASVSCIVSGGDLPINFIWLLNRAPIEPYNGIVIEKRGKRISALTIESLKASNMGNYSCIAENPGGTVEYTAELVVNG